MMPPPDKALEVRPSGPNALARLGPTVDAARAFRTAAKSEATRRAYASDWRLFEAYCADHGFVSLPALPEVLCLYLTYMADTLKRRVSTIERARAAISVAHQFAYADFKKRGLACENPSFSTEAKETMKGIRRVAGIAKNKKTPVLMADMLTMLRAVDLDTKVGVRDRALLSVGFTGAFRRAELVAIDIEHLTFEPEGVVIFVPRSKTDQEGAGRHVGIPYAPKDAAECPVRALEAWLQVMRTDGIVGGPCFRAVRGQTISKRALANAGVAAAVKKYAALTGKDPDLFGGHSLRSGFATQSVMDDVPEAEIMRQTGHKSIQVFRGYVQRASVFQKNAAKGVWK